MRLRKNLAFLLSPATYQQSNKWIQSWSVPQFSRMGFTILVDVDCELYGIPWYMVCRTLRI